MTMQTEAPIESHNLQNSNRTLMWFTGSAEFDMDQPYQRGHVWGVERKQNLIRSILLGCPIGAIVTNDRFGSQDFSEPGYSDERNWAYAIIDGKQRVSAIIGFINNEFAVPASWFRADRIEFTEDTDDGPYIRFEGLAVNAKRGFQNTGIAVSEGKFKSLADEQAIFALINYGGVEQGASDL